MPKVTYTPPKDAGFPDETEQFGHSFVAGKAVEVENDEHVRKFDGNPYFTVDWGDKAEEPKRGPGRPKSH